MKIETATVLGCDFCGKAEKDLAFLVKAANSVCICDVCVDVCNKIIAETKASAALPELDPDLLDTSKEAGK